MDANPLWERACSRMGATRFFRRDAGDAFASRLAPTVGNGGSEGVGWMQIPCGSEPAREWEQLGFEGGTVKTPSRAGSLPQWAMVAVREWVGCKSLVGASLLANGSNSVSRVALKTPSRASSLPQWAMVAVREWDGCKSLVGASLLANGSNSVSRVALKAPSRAGSLPQWAMVAVREWDGCKSLVGASLLANGGNSVSRVAL